ncbi:MAG: hypothetical protein II049_09090 [Clostridia bacterium]|nr:hypothetical protein [Clostridia bacterium]
MLGKALIVFFGVIAVLGIVGIVMLKKKGKTETRDDTENVVDLNDRFNRARYMNQENN